MVERSRGGIKENKKGQKGFAVACPRLGGRRKKVGRRSTFSCSDLGKGTIRAAKNTGGKLKEASSWYEWSSLPSMITNQGTNRKFEGNGGKKGKVGKLIGQRNNSQPPEKF